MNTTATEDAAILEDARKRVAELERVRAALMPDADDARVMSELVSIESELCHARAVLAGE
jgi:hypothetical protein